MITVQKGLLKMILKSVSKFQKNSRSIFWCFQGVEKGCIWNKWDNIGKEILAQINRNPKKKKSVLFLSGSSFRDTDDSKNCRERKGTIFYSSLPLSPAHEHSYIYLQLYMWDDYHLFLIGSHIITRLLLDGIYLLWEVTFDWIFWMFI